MADLFTSAYSNTYSNAGAAVAAAKLGANALKNVINQADVGRELIVKISADAGILDSELNAAIRYVTTGHATPPNDQNGPDAFTVAAVGTADGSAFVAGTTTVVFLRAQGTGTLNAAGVKAAAEAADANGTTFTVTTEAVFTPAK